MSPVSTKEKPENKTAGPWAADWLCIAGAAGLVALALWHLLALAGYSASDPLLSGEAPVKNFLGPAGALWARLSYSVAGLAAWLAVAVLPLAAFMAWKEKNFLRSLWILAGLLMLTLTGAGLLGFAKTTFSAGGGLLPLGGAAGAALAESCTEALGKAGGMTACILAAVLGLAAVVWGLWPVLGPFLEPGDYLPEEKDAKAEPPAPKTGKPDAADKRDASEPGPPIPPEPPKIREQESQTAPQPEEDLRPAPPRPAPEQDGGHEPGPRILARKPGPPQVENLDQPKAKDGYRLPPLDILQEPERQKAPDHDESLRLNSALLQEKLADFNVKGDVVEVAPGPVVTTYEFKPAPGVKISKVANLSDDLAMNLRASAIRIVAPIPGKAAIGIEIPSRIREMVYLREILASPAYVKAQGKLTVAMGKDILGAPVVNDLASMPHLLIAGSTGSGKSVFINTLVCSLLYKATPEEVRLLMVDPKRIELSTYNDIPHLLYPIITNPQEATAGLRWAVAEMERRYELLARMGVRNIRSFNSKLRKGQWPKDPNNPEEEIPESLPYIVIIIDEMADLMMVASKEVESLVTRLAQMARAAGIHLVLATQRPSVDVITGLIKANFPARISFQVTSRIDSRTILDQQGAESLLGKGDMLFVPPGTASIARLHGAYVSDSEIEAVASFVRKQAKPDYDESIVSVDAEGNGLSPNSEDMDERYPDAVALVKEAGQASASYIQRRLRVGYNRAARMIEQMEADGIVGPPDGSKPREVLYRD